MRKAKRGMDLGLGFGNLFFQFTHLGEIASFKWYVRFWDSWRLDFWVLFCGFIVVVCTSTGALFDGNLIGFGWNGGMVECSGSGGFTFVLFCVI